MNLNQKERDHVSSNNIGTCRIQLDTRTLNRMIQDNAQRS